jgi:hypothetical protein
MRPLQLLPLALCGFLAALPLVSHASDAVPPALQKFVNDRGGGEFLSRFPVAEGIEGHVVRTPSGDRQLVYTLAEGRLVMMGTLFDSLGASITEAHFRDQVFDARGAWARVGREIPVIKFPKAAPDVIGFFEPHCGACSAAMDQMEKDGITVNWVGLSFLSEDSPRVLAGILDARKPWEAMTSALRARGPAGMKSWISEHPASDKTLARVTNELALADSVMKQAGVRGTPTFLIKKGDVVETVDFGALRRHLKVPGA